MQLHHDNRVFFENTTHSYLLDGEKLLMGVTSLMKKHSLSADYGGIKKEVLENAAKEGTAIHHELQDYEEGKTVFASELIDEYKRLGLKFIEAEYPVSDYELVASAIDMVYEGSKPNTVSLWDIKCTSKYHQRALEWQLGIYKVLFEKQNPDIEVESCYCLWIDKKARKINRVIRVEPVTKEEVEALLDCERRGVLYVDGQTTPGADLVLSNTELAMYVDSYDKILKFKEKIKEAEEVLKGLDERILQYLTKQGVEEMEGPEGIRFKVKKPYTSERVDSTALKKNFPAVYEKCKKTTTTGASLMVSKKQ